jgi:hypothetical protein
LRETLRCSAGLKARVFISQSETISSASKL